MHPMFSRLDQKHRRLFRIANVALILGLVPWVFREYITFNHNWLDAFCGFFMGLYITIMLFCLRAARRCRPNGV
jgi:H+/Cl- antiporter ClcA